MKWLTITSANLKNESLCVNAAAHGLLDILKYLHQQGFPIGKETLDAATKNGHLECVKFIKDLVVDALLLPAGMVRVDIIRHQKLVQNSLNFGTGTSHSSCW